MQYLKDSDKAGRDARGKKYNGSARYSLPQIKTYFKHSVSEKGGDRGISPGELWVLSFSGKYLAPEREISLSCPAGRNPKNIPINPNL